MSLTTREAPQATTRGAPQATREAPEATVDDTTRLHIDWTACDGRGLCVELLPEILARDEWGYPIARSREREPQVPRHMRSYAREAVARCPMLALTLTRR
jgi:ferredoxin